MRLCAATIPDVAKTTACMKSHVSDLSPRCRTVFNAAAGGRPTKAAEAKPAPVPAKSEPRRAAAKPQRVTAETRPVARKTPAPAVVTRENPRPVRAAALPTRRAADPIAPATTGNASPAAPAIRSSLPGLEGVAASIAQSCRDGLIDPFTCRNTFQALKVTE